ncbi:MAG: MFS transporter [Oscillochloris sp.]|nr:MFS transporter [Oscillochloris sp.]
MGVLGRARHSASISQSPVVLPVAPPEPIIAPEPLSPAEVRRGLRISTVEGAVATVHISITGAIGGSVFLTGFALMLGADNFQLGILGALPFIGQMFQFVGAYLEALFGNRRRLVLLGSLLGRLVWALVLTLPFLGLAPALQLTIFFVGLGISYACNGVAGNAWLSWMSDLVPPRRRGSYFGVRNTVAGLSAMLSVYLAGQALDYARAGGSEAQGYAIVFGVAVLAALGAALLIARQPEPPLTPKPQVSITNLLSGPWRDIRFRSFVLGATGWAFVTGISGPFFNAYGLTTLGLSFSTLALTAIVTSGVSLIFTPLIGQLQDRLGDRLVLALCMLGTVLLPWGWVFSTPGNILPLWLTAIFSGVFWPGVNQGLTNLLMDRSPADQRGAAMATHSALIGIGTLVSGLLGGALAGILVHVQLNVGVAILGNLTMLFAVSSLGRLLIAGALWHILRGEKIPALMPEG